MRIHIYARDFPISATAFGAGLEKAVHGLAGGLVHNGAQVTIVCNGPKTGSYVSEDGYEILCFSPPRNKGLSLSRDLEAYINGCKDPGLFVLNGAFNPTVYAVSRACERRRIPYFCWPHDPYHRALFRTRRHLKWPYWYLRERKLLMGATAIQVFSSRQAQWLHKLGISTPTLEIVNGYGVADVLPDSMLEWRLEGPAKLLFLGRFDYYNKALDVLLEAFATVANQIDACLTLQGPDWGDLETLKRRAQSLGLHDDRVQFREPDFTRTSAQIIADHDVLLLPSRYEGFAMASIEAMCAARVLMVSDINGISEHVRRSRSGVVVTPDIQSVKAGLLDLLSSRSKWKQMGISGRNYALKHFQWNHIGAEVLSRYSHLVAERGGPHTIPGAAAFLASAPPHIRSGNARHRPFCC